MTDDYSYFTLCEAVTWIAFRVPYRIKSLNHAMGMIGGFDFEAAEVLSAAAELKSKLAHPNSGILIKGIDEYKDTEVPKTIPYDDFLADIEFYLHDETIGPSSETRETVSSKKKLPRWKYVQVLKEDIKREWSEGVYLPDNIPEWPGKPFFNVQEAINILAYHDPEGPEKFLSIQQEHGIKIGSWDAVALWAGAKKRLEEAALAAKVTVLGMRIGEGESVPIPATDWFTLQINPEIMTVTDDKDLKNKGASKTVYSRNGENYWRNLSYRVDEIKQVHDEIYGLVQSTEDHNTKVGKARKVRIFDYEEEVILKNEIKMVIAIAKGKWPEEKDAPSYRDMARQISRSNSYGGKYKEDTIRAILRGVYSPSIRLGIGGYSG